MMLISVNLIAQYVSFTPLRKLSHVLGRTQVVKYIRNIGKEIILNTKFRIFWRIKAQMARKLYEHMRRDAASIRIQKHARSHAARRSYTKLQEAAIVIQTGLRSMAARNEFRRRRRNKAASTIQVTYWLRLRDF